MDSNLPETSSKNRKIFEGEEITNEAQDGMSQLPDNILCHILSLLPTKFAAQTGILSKRWKELWLSVPVLEFQMHLWANYEGNMKAFDRFAKTKIESFTNFLNRLLAVRDTSGIKKFGLVCDHPVDSRCLDNWLSALHNVQELDLEIWELGEFQWSPFADNPLEILKLGCGLLLNFPSAVSFPRLKILHLHSTTYAGNASVEKLLSSCPVLEDLQVSRTNRDNVTNFVIAVPSLKRLALDFSTNEGELYNEDDYENAVEHKLIITAPNLEYLSLVDYMSDSIQVSSMASVTESRIAVCKILEDDSRTAEQISNYGSNVCRIFRSIPNVKRLSIGEFTMEVSLDLKFQSCSLLSSDYTINCFLGQNLWLSSYICSLRVNLSKVVSHFYFFQRQGITSPGLMGWFSPQENQGMSYSWKPPQNVPECLLFSLKNVEIRRITGRVEEEVKLLKYFLENALVLEKMTICYEEFEVSGGPMDATNYPAARRLDDRVSFIDKLMNCAKGSAACQLDVQMPELSL